MQCRTLARQQDQFSAGKVQSSWLSWDDIQKARCAAEEKLAALPGADEGSRKVDLVRDITILRLLADQPPDRVGVVRTLRLGFTLKHKRCGSYMLDLSEPGAHKTSAWLGPIKTSINASITPWLDSYVSLNSLLVGSYLFHENDDHSKPLRDVNWTKFIKALFKRHSGVALCPKDVRSSFVTFLRSSKHGDDAVKAAAVAMRHSSKTQASAAYDKNGDRLVRAAMKVASDHSAKFTATSRKRQ